LPPHASTERDGREREERRGRERERVAMTCGSHVHIGDGFSQLLQKPSPVTWNSVLLIQYKGF